MRERHIELMFYRERDRITPARAGKTHRRSWPCSSAKDHPRSCGKDAARGLIVLIMPGSPPLVRERLGYGTFIIFHVRITPARAGKTSDADK